MMLQRIRWVFLLIALAAAGSLSAQPTAAAGKELFTNNCASCHNRNMRDNLTGPALGGVQERWAAYPEADLYTWIRGSQAMIAAGHPRAVELWNKWKPNIMQNFPQLTDDQIGSILLFVKETYEKGNQPPPPGTAGATPGAPGGEKEGNNWLFWSLAIILGLLAFALMRIINNLGNVARVQEGLPPIQRSLAQTLSSKGAVSILVFALVLIFGYKTVDNATKMQRQQGYQPDQPIWFSHQIHAGINKIECNYCHDGARRSKQSIIPAANTCMNCHSAIKKGTRTGTSEITKIFASIGYDPIQNKYIDNYENWTEKAIEDLYKRWIGQEYAADKSVQPTSESAVAEADNQWDGIVKALKNDSDGKIQGPIEWVRIHNAPDHVYFNHSQHVTVGQVACQKCHGPVETMDVVYQYSTLGMGWCVNCHRETEVKFDNAFYKQYDRYHKEIAGGQRANVTVQDIGGLECQKCHY